MPTPIRGLKAQGTYRKSGAFIKRTLFYLIVAAGLHEIAWMD